MLKVSELYIHPIKSLGGISLKTADVTDRGLKYDRRWLLIDENNRFFTQREFPRMTLLKTNILGNILEVSDKNNSKNKIEILMGEFSNEKLQVKIWDDTVEANIVNVNINKWFSGFIGIKCKLVYMPDEAKRSVSKDFARKNEIVSFADGYPFLILGQSALDDLNRRLTNPVPITNFRPNIVFTGGNPFEEDDWSEIRIGKMTFIAVKPCARCVITTIDQKTAAKNKEPLATLSTYRRYGSKILFGENLIHEGTGKINVGDEIKIVSYKK